MRGPSNRCGGSSPSFSAKFDSTTNKKRTIMPLYQYTCSECGHELEELQKFTDEPLKECPECKKEALEKMISSDTGFCLMGYGWHKPGMSVGNK